MRIHRNWLSFQKHQGECCRYCGTNKKLTKDHIVPKSRGGLNARKNYQVLCRYCNSTKGALTDIEVVNILRSIEERGVWYDWEKPYNDWLDYLKLKRKEYGLPELKF